MIPLRQSLLNQYLFCPKSWQLEHLQKQKPEHRSHAALHGSVVHELLHQLCTHNWDLDPRTAYPDLLDTMEFEDEIPVDWNHRESESAKYCAEAVSMIDGYRRKAYNQDARVILSEAPFTVKIGRVLFTGTVDQIRENLDGTLELIDFKTSQRVPPQVALHNSYQFILYSLAMLLGQFPTPEGTMEFRRLPDFATWYHLRNHIPYKRKTTVGERVYQKGDEKGGDPRHRISITPDMIRSFR